MRLTAKRSQAQKHNVGTPCIHLQIKGDIPCLISGNGDISSECHDPENSRIRAPKKNRNPPRTGFRGLFSVMRSGLAGS